MFIFDLASFSSAAKVEDILRINLLDGCGGECARGIMDEIRSEFKGSIREMVYSELKRAIFIKYLSPIDTSRLGEILREKGVKYEIRY